MNPLVSIIIPTVEGDEHIESCVQSVKDSTYQNIEIIVVKEGLERSAQRNIGINKAKGKYFLFLDSDQEVTAHLIYECVDKLENNPSIVAIYIPELIRTFGFFGRLRNWERGFYTSTCVDVPRFIRSHNCPYFDENLNGPEDSDWDRYICGKKYTCFSKVLHYDNIGIRKYFSKKAYYSKSMKRFAKKHPSDKVLKFWYRCFWIFIEKGKWKRLLKKPHYTICLIGLIFIRGIIYLCAKKS